MARDTEVTVFVDDAVLGALPPVCARDGVSTTSQLHHRQPVGDGARLGAAWLLVLAGPLGWIALLYIATSRAGGAEVLSVLLPWSDQAYERQRAADRQRRAGGWAAAACAGMLLIVLLSHSLERVPAPVDALVVAGLVAGGAWAMTVNAMGTWRVGRESVTIGLDASRRWVTLGRVHPDFATAVRATQALRDIPR